MTSGQGDAIREQWDKGVIHSDAVAIAIIEPAICLKAIETVFFGDDSVARFNQPTDRNVIKHVSDDQIAFIAELLTLFFSESCKSLHNCLQFKPMNTFL